MGPPPVLRVKLGPGCARFIPARECTSKKGRRLKRLPFVRILADSVVDEVEHGRVEAERQMGSTHLDIFVAVH